MKKLATESSSYRVMNTKMPLWVLAFLTVGLTNCGKTGPKNDISQEFEEPFQTDDISAVPLEEKDLEALSQQGTHYTLLESPFFLVKDASKKFFSKSEQTYIFSKEAKTFSSTDKSTTKQGEVSISRSMTLTFESEAPFALRRAESNEKVISSKDSKTIDQTHYTLDCSGSNVCTFDTTRNEHKFKVEIQKNRINLLNLKTLLLPQLIARHRFPMERVRLNFQAPTSSGIYNTKAIYYLEDSAGDGDLNYTIVFKKYFPQKEDGSKYVLEKLSHSIARDGKPISFSTDMIKSTSISKDEYEKIEIFPSESTSPWQLEPTDSKKIEFVHAIVKGNTRHFLKNNRTQKVTHHPNHTEVELLPTSSSGTADRTQPTDLESNNQKNHYVESEWQSEIVSLLKNTPTSDEKAFEILKFLTSKIRGTDVNGTLSFKEIFDLKRGDCSEFAKTFVLLARDSGIPARKHRGYVIPKDISVNEKGDFNHLGYAHAWANYFSVEEGEWQLADAALYMHIDNRNAYLLDFGVDSPSDIEKEDYLDRPELHIRFVFDKGSKEKVIKELQ